MGKPQATVPPWHLWGGTQVVQAPANAFTTPGVFVTDHTLVRLQYARPESWRFMLHARVVSAETGGPGNQSQLDIFFELLVGLGRSNVRIPLWQQFDTLVWNFGAPAPVDQVLWTNLALTNTVQRFIDPTFAVLPQGLETNKLTDTIVADHLTLIGHVRYTTDIANPPPAVVELTGLFAPNTHIRPDWFEPEPVFAGGETEGR